MALYDEELDERPNNNKEFQAIGSVKWNTYKKYFEAVRNPFLIIFVVLAFVGAELSVHGLNYFMAKW